MYDDAEQKVFPLLIHYLCILFRLFDSEIMHIRNCVQCGPRKCICSEYVNALEW